MPTLDRSLPFTSDLHGMTESGLSSLTMGHYALDGDPSSGCLRLTGTPTAGGSTVEAVMVPANTHDWTDLFPGLGDGDTVTAVQVVSLKRKDADNGSLRGNGGFGIRIYANDGVTEVTSAPLYGQVNLVPNAWTDLPAGSSVGVIGAYQAATTRVRLQIKFTANDDGEGAAIDIRLDTVVLRVTYTEGDANGGTTDPPPGSVADPQGPILGVLGTCGPQPLFDRASVLKLLEQAQGWFQDRRYFLSVGRRTLCLDLDTGGWSDAGYGNVTAAITAIPNKEPFYGFTSLEARPKLAFLLSRRPFPPTQTFPDGYAPDVVSVTHSEMHYIGAHIKRDWRREVEFVFVGEGRDRSHRKRARRLTVWGYWRDRTDGSGNYAPVGTAEMESDTGFIETRPIFAHYLRENARARIYPEGVLLVQEWLPAMVGRVFTVRLRFETDCVVIQDRMLEYTVIG